MPPLEVSSVPVSGMLPPSMHQVKPEFLLCAMYLSDMRSPEVSTRNWHEGSSIAAIRLGHLPTAACVNLRVALNACSGTQTDQNFQLKENP
jgi:hypothetical protein